MLLPGAVVGLLLLGVCCRIFPRRLVRLQRQIIGSMVCVCVCVRNLLATIGLLLQALYFRASDQVLVSLHENAFVTYFRNTVALVLSFTKKIRTVIQSSNNISRHYSVTNLIGRAEQESAVDVMNIFFEEQAVE
jgi:hypothetical protein